MALQHASKTSTASEAGLVQEMSNVELRDRDGETAGEDEAMRFRRDNSHSLGESSVEAVEAEFKTYKRRWFGLVILVLLNITVSWDWLTFAPVASHAATYYAVTESTINTLSIVFQFSFVAVFPLTISILHRGPKPSIVVAAALLLLGNWIRFAGSHSRTPRGGEGGFAAVMVGQVLCGLAQPFVLAAPTRFSDMWFSNRGRVAATAVASLANPFGAAVGQLVNPFWVVKSEDVSGMVLYVSIIATAICIPAFFVPTKPPTAVAHSSQVTRLPIRKSVARVATSVEVWLIMIPYWVYVGFFNSISSLLNQMMRPYGFSDDEAGIGGAVLIVVGLVASAIVSPILDRTKAFLTTIKILVPVAALCLFVFYWMPGTRNLAGPYVVLAVLGASAFSLVPVALEYLAELSYPVSPEITSTLAWAGGQLLGGCFVFISDALQSGEDADPPRNMHRALIFQAVVGLAVMPLPLCLGLFGRGDKVSLKRVRSEDAAGLQETRQ